MQRNVKRLEAETHGDTFLLVRNILCDFLILKKLCIQ